MSYLGYVGPMFVFNLNGCQAPGNDGPSSCYYSLLGPDGSPRPIFAALQNLDKSAMEDASTGAPAEAEATQEAPEETPEATVETSLNQESTDQATTPDSP